MPIALVEAVVADQADSPWLGRIELVLVTMLFVLAGLAITGQEKP